METLRQRVMGQYQKDLEQVSRQLFELAAAAFAVRVLGRLPEEFVAMYEEDVG